MTRPVAPLPTLPTTAEALGLFPANGPGRVALEAARRA